MEKSANTRYPITDLIRNRWSPLAFSEQRIEPEKLLQLFEAARWAPSSYNEQPWSFIVARKEDREEHERLLGCLVEGNIAWARHAPVLILSVARLQFQHNQDPNRHALHDVGLATENLVLQAEALGLHAHLMAGFSADKARKVYQIPTEFEPVAVMAVGYLGDVKNLSEPLRKREEAERVRKPLSEMLFSGKWGQTSTIISN